MRVTKPKEAWQSYCLSTKRLIDTAKIARLLILTKDNSARIQSPKDRSVIYTETEEDTLELLLNTNFANFVKENHETIKTRGHETTDVTWGN